MHKPNLTKTIPVKGDITAMTAESQEREIALLYRLKDSTKPKGSNKDRLV